MYLLKTFGFLLFLSPSLAFGFNWHKCRHNVGAPGLAGMTSSTTQFTSSWGACSMLGMTEQRKLFVASNIENLKTDAARGEGEYLNTLASLYGCDQISAHYLSNLLKTNYGKIFGNDNPESISADIDSLVLSNQELVAMCIQEG